MKTSCGTSVVLQGTQHEGALEVLVLAVETDLGPPLVGALVAAHAVETFAFLSSDAPANKNDPELFEPEPVPEDKVGSGDDSEEQSEGDNVISCGPVHIL